MSESTYYEQWGPLTRRMVRVGHRARFVAKKSLGLRPSLLVELRWRLGDEIMALPIFEALRAKWPQARIEVLTHQPDLFIDHPFVDAVNPPSPSPDLYYLLRGAPRDTPRIAHYAREADVPTPSMRPRLYYRDWDSPLLREVPAGEGPLVALTPGASWATKRWSAARWLELAQALHARGCRVFEVCGAGESAGLSCTFAGRTTVGDAARLLHAADAVVASDSGLMHLARAAGAPVVALFGPTDATLLIGDDPGAQRVNNGRECAGCWNAGRMQAPGECPLGVPDCLGTVTVEQVAARVWATLARG